MEIVIHTIDNESARFVQEDPEQVALLLSKVHPQRLFQQRNIIIQGKMAVSGFNTSLVEMVEFITDVKPQWQVQTHVDTIQVISEEKYEALMLKLVRSLKGERPRVKVGDSMEGCAEFHMRSGRDVLVQFHSVVKGKVDERMFLQSLFESGALAIPIEKGGWAILNPENIVRYVLNPGPADAPANSWLAARGGESLASRMSMEIDIRRM